MKKVLSILLALLMAAGLFAIGAGAEITPGYTLGCGCGNEECIVYGRCQRKSPIDERSDGICEKCGEAFVGFRVYCPNSAPRPKDPDGDGICNVCGADTDPCLCEEGYPWHIDLPDGICDVCGVIIINDNCFCDEYVPVCEEGCHCDCCISWAMHPFYQWTLKLAAKGLWMAEWPEWLLKGIFYAGFGWLFNRIF